MQACQDQSRFTGCQAPVPTELEGEHLCVLHFIQSVEQVCAEMRRETAKGWASAARQLEIAGYLKAAATKLSCVTTGSLRLSDDVKKRVLTTLLMLMITRESLDRCSGSYMPELRTSNASGAPTPAPAAAHL